MLCLHLLMYTGFVSTFRLLWIILLWTLEYKFLFLFFSSLGYKSEIAGTNGNSMFNFLGSHCTVFSQQLHHFTFLPATHKGFNSSTSWSTYYFPVIITINIEYDLILTEQITSGKILFPNTVTFWGLSRHGFWREAIQPSIK